MSQTKSWLARLSTCLKPNPPAPPPNSPPSNTEKVESLSPKPKPPAAPPLTSELDAYTQALDTLTADPQTLLPVLLARDAVATAWQQSGSLPPTQSQRLIALDTRLKIQTRQRDLSVLFDWRQTLTPPTSAWWWMLDDIHAQKTATREQANDLPWILLTGTFTLLTAALTTDILTRLWDGAPDIISVFGSLITLTLTASPLAKRGEDLGKWLINRIPIIKSEHRAEALTALTGFALIGVFIIRLLLPNLAAIYNDQGYIARQTGDLTRARQKLQRAIALDPELAKAYYNLAKVYQRLQQPNEALTWYQQAVAVDLNLVAAYREIGHLYNAQGEYERAEKILLAGLTLLDQTSLGTNDTEQQTNYITQYKLLSDLGWTYFAQGRYKLAKQKLSAAVSMEKQLDIFERAEQPRTQYRMALPHYYLAQLYEQDGEIDTALEHWITSLGLLECSWYGCEHQEWHTIINEHIDALQEELP